MKKALVGLAGIATTLALTPAAAGAASITVNTTSDASGVGAPCTLREAITSANADNAAGNGCASGTGSDSISFSLTTPATITLGGTQLPAISDLLPDTLTITGPGPTPGALTVSANNASRVFEVASGSALTISAVTITGGRSEGTDGVGAGASGDPAFGGGLYSEGVLNLEDAIVTGNSAIGGDGAAGSSPGVGPGGPGGPGGGARGGGIYNQGDLSVTGSTVSGNHAFGGSGGAGGNGAAAGGDGGAGDIGGDARGGGISNFNGAVTVEDSTVSGNEALAGVGGAGGNGVLGETKGSGGDGMEGTGGGLHNFNGTTFTVASSTLNGNEATGSSGGAVGGGAGTGGAAGEPERGFGGGILGEGLNGGVSLQNSTVSGNTAGSTGGAGGQGGGVWVSGPSNILHSTLVGNTAGLGANLTTFAATTLRATIIANPTTQAAGNCHNSGFITSSGFNLEDGATCGLNPPATDLENTEPLLGALAAWGGPTMTHLPATTSPAVNAVTAGCPPPNFDQRGESRSAPCDIGAVERQPGDPEPDLGGSPPAQPGTTAGPTGQRAAALKKCKKKKKKSKKAKKKCKKKAKRLPV